MVKLRTKYGDFSIFQDGSRRHLGLSNFENFNVGTLNMARYSGLFMPPHKVISTLLSLRCLTAH